MKNNIIIVLVFLFWINQAKSQNVGKIVIGTKHIIHSSILKENREYWISLPESYHKKELSYKKYPLLFILDGNVHFRAISGIVNYMSFDLHSNTKIPEMIVIGIKNVNRRRDYTPDKVVTRRKNDSGGVENFLRFLKEELIPKLDKKYRTTNYRILFGHSLGGLLSVYAYMKEDSPFNAFIAADPSFGTWDCSTMDKKLDAVTSQSFKRFLYIATANWGKRNVKNRDRHVRLFDALNSKCEDEFYAKLEFFENENHATIPLIAFYNGISSIFEGYGISYRDVNNMEELIQKYKSLSKRLSWEFDPPENLVNRIGYKVLKSKNQIDKEKAFAFFYLNTKNYPGSYNAFDSLGEAYEILGDNKMAIKNYKISLYLNPDNEHASTKIKTLEINDN